MLYSNGDLVAYSTAKYYKSMYNCYDYHHFLSSPSCVIVTMCVSVNLLCICFCVMCLCNVCIPKKILLTLLTIESNIVLLLYIGLICLCLLCFVLLFHCVVLLENYKLICHYYTKKSLVVSLTLNWSKTIYCTYLEVLPVVKCSGLAATLQYTPEDQYIIQMFAIWLLQT